MELAASIATIRVNTKSAEGAKAALLLLLGTVLAAAAVGASLGLFAAFLLL